MQELGMELKSIRESKGLSLEQVQQETKIRSRYLDAIEAGDLSVLPGMVYARGFIKSYAEYLGTDGQELLERHGLAADTRPTADAADASLRRSAPVSAPAGKGFSLGGSARMLPQVALVVVVLGVVSLVYALVVKSGGDGQETTDKPAQTQSVGEQTAQKDTQPEPQQQAQAAQPAPPPEPPKPKTVVQEQQKAQNRTTYAVTSTDPMTLHMSASDSCWVQVIADGKTIETGIVKAGESRSWQANQSVSILTGKSKFITLKVNDQPVQFEPQLRGYTYEFQKQQGQPQPS